MARRPTAAQLREKRSRTLVIAFSVVFLIVMVVQGPKLLKSMHGGSAPVGGTVAGALPAGVNPTAPTATVSGGSVAVVADGHLGNLSRFAFKDPFHALVNVSTGTAATGKSATKTPPPPPAAKADKPTPAAAAAAAVGPTVTFTATKTPPNAAVLKTNGRRQVIFVGDDFPTDNPLFTLVGLGKKNIRIGVLGGSFTSGVPTIKLATGKRLTLANQADGSRYVLQLLRLTFAVPPPPTTGGSSSTPATPGSTTTTTTTTTPTFTTKTPTTTTQTTTTPTTTTPTTTTPATTTTTKTAG
jgi:hypothetical protein